MLSAEVNRTAVVDMALEDGKSATVCTISRGTYLLEVDVEATRIGATAQMSSMQARRLEPGRLAGGRGLGPIWPRRRCEEMMR